MIYKFLTTQ